MKSPKRSAAFPAGTRHDSGPGPGWALLRAACAGLLVAPAAVVLLPLSAPGAPPALPAPPPPAAGAAAPSLWEASAPRPAAGLSSRADRALTEDLDAYADQIQGRFAVAAVALDGAADYGYAAGEPFPTASAVKVDIAALLLLQDRSGDRALDSADRTRIEEALRYSDNEAADALFADLGATAGFDERIGELGLQDTVSSDTGRWGQTRTTAEDRITLLQSIFTSAGPLAEEDREWLRSLMGDVAPEQAWGVSAASDGAAELKNGWAPQDSEGGLWAANSFGRVRAGGQEYLVAVLSAGHATYGAGIDCTEHVASAVVDALASARRSGHGAGPDEGG